MSENIRNTNLRLNLDKAVQNRKRQIQTLYKKTNPRGTLRVIHWDSID